VRLLLISAALLLTGCGPGLVFNNSQEMSRDQMLDRASHIFIGVIEHHEFENWLFLRVPGDHSGFWKVLRRRVRVENVLRGVEPRKTIDIYEIFWTDGASGDWNATQDDQRYLFLTRTENGRYHVVRDWCRSIFRIYSGKHDRLPLDENHPFWEHIGLLTWWPGQEQGLGDPNRMDPGQALGLWRTAKLALGLVRNPERETRVFGCQVLMLMGRWQDECWEQLSSEDRAIWSAHGLIPVNQIPRGNQGYAMKEWVRAAGSDTDMMRLLTTVNNPSLRREFCRLFSERFPNDRDNGCPADQPPPATIVTKDGDIPLVGAWPQMQQ
jgi:hypothetical protein